MNLKVKKEVTLKGKVEVVINLRDEVTTDKLIDELVRRYNQDELDSASEIKMVNLLKAVEGEDVDIEFTFFPENLNDELKFRAFEHGCDSRSVAEIEEFFGIIPKN